MKVTAITIILLNLVEVFLSLDIRDLTLGTYPAHTLANGRQLLTSSTLSWADISRIQSGQIPGERVVVAWESAVCRVRDGDKLRPGRTDRSGLCIVEGVKERQYQVLVDMKGMARLEWRKWDMFSNPEKGTVAYNDKTFVAQLEMLGGEKTIGDLDLTRGLNGEVRVFVGAGKVERKTAGLALVELEPVRYRLENISFLMSKEISSTLFSVGTVHLTSSQEEGDEWKEEEEMMEYTYPGYEHWGHIPGTVRGLPASALMGKTLSHFRWGLEGARNKTGQYAVRYSLRAGTGVNITVSGRLVRREEAYTAQLVMVYKDGATARQDVSSSFISVAVENIMDDTRGPYNIITGVLAPTTTRRPTTRPPPTTPSPELKTIPPHAHMFLAPTPTPTLFPPPPPPVTKPNPLRQFYPDTEDPSPETDPTKSGHVRVTVMSTASSIFSLHWTLTVLVFSLAPNSYL